MSFHGYSLAPAAVHEDDWVLVDSSASQRQSIEIVADSMDETPLTVNVQETDERSVVEDDSSSDSGELSESCESQIPIMVDSGISASMNISCESTQHRQIPPSETQDSMPCFSPSENEKPFNEHQPASKKSEVSPDEVDISYSSAGMKVETVNVSKTLMASQSMGVQVADGNQQLISNEAMTFNVSAESKSDEYVVNTEEFLDEPKLETETKVEIMPDGTVVTRKVTKTIRKRVVAKSVLTKSEEGEVTIKPDDSNSERVRKFLALGSTSSTARPAADASPDDASAASRFLSMSKSDFEQLEQTHAEDLPCDTAIERKITVVQSQTTCVEGDANNPTDILPAASATEQRLE